MAVRLIPGAEHTHHGTAYQVERIEARGVDFEQHWARLVRTDGQGKKGRVISVRWVRFDNLGRDPMEG